MPEAVYDFVAIHKQMLGEHKKKEVVCDVCGIPKRTIWGIAMQCEKCRRVDYVSDNRP